MSQSLSISEERMANHIAEQVKETLTAFVGKEPEGALPRFREAGADVKFGPDGDVDLRSDPEKVAAGFFHVEFVGLTPRGRAFVERLKSLNDGESGANSRA